MRIDYKNETLQALLTRADNAAARCEWNEANYYIRKLTALTNLRVEKALYNTGGLLTEEVEE